jgi:myo-inositol 2-dehydrogenase / D-chiro-inositol 1-dehydrogenase
MSITRRTFVGSSVAALASASPNGMIQVGQIGCGRIARSSEIMGMLHQREVARLTAVCDLDAVRVADAKQLIERAYQSPDSVKTYANYKDMLADKSIDAVCISTPDHWHSQIAMEAALAGKDIYIQKPASLTIVEGRQMADTLKKSGRILQLGSQQRSDPAFRLATELVRNGRIGKVLEVYIGLPTDPAGGNEKPMPVPKNLNYDAWLGSTPNVPYTEDRVHPQSDDPRARYERPGWLRCEQFGAGMITGWGSHHVDIAHWAMNTELTGPVAMEASAEFPKSGLWNVHGLYHIKMTYANGAVVYISDKYPNGVKFLGEEGWIWVTRGSFHPRDVGPGKPRSQTIDASDLRWLRDGIKDNEIHLHASPQNNHHLDWLASIKSRQATVAPPEVGHRSCTACLLGQVAMRLNRPLKWDPEKERFVGDSEADKWLTRPQRAPYGTNYVKQA